MAILILICYKEHFYTVIHVKPESKDQKFKFLLYISHSYSVPICLPLEKEIQKRQHKVHWFSDRTEGKGAIATFNNTFDDIRPVIDYEPDIVLVATNEVPDFISGLKVQIFHGFNAQKRISKKNQFSHFNIRGFFDLYCTQGPSTTAYFQKLAQQHQHFKVVETGWPKMDTLFPLNKNTPHAEKRTILISSTFTKRLSLAYNDEVYKEIMRLIASDKYHFLMVLHPKIPKNVQSRWQKLSGKNFQFFDTTDLNPIFRKADMMFADTTSAIQEFILQNKPVIAFANNTTPDYLINIDRIEEIENAFDMSAEQLEPFQHKISDFIHNLHPYDDGKSSARVIDASIDYLLEDKTTVKSKPWNLLRKYKIRKRLKYFTLKSYNRPYHLTD